MIVDDDSDARMLRRVLSSAKQSNASSANTEPKSVNVTASTPVRYSAGDWRKAEEASNKTGSIQSPSLVDPIPVKNLVVQNQPSPSPVYSTPLTPAPVTNASASVVTTITNPIKTATPDIVLFDDSTIPVETMLDLIFEDIGGQELINISRTDTINGQKILYQPIKNINSINQEYNPNNILGLQKTSDKYFSGYAIKFEERVPKVSNSPDGNPIYIDSAGSLVIDSINLNNDEQIEIQIAVSGTIYETEI